MPSTLRLLLLPTLASVASAAPSLVAVEGRLVAPEIAPSEFRSGLPVAVADLNGDGRDDIARIHFFQQLSLEFQTTPGAPFEHHFHGPIATGRAWSVAVAQLDDDARGEILVAGNVLSPRPAGIELLDWDGGTYVSFWIRNGDIVPQGTIFSDLDDDGDLDVFACHDTADLLKFENLGGGSFAENPTLLDTALPNSADDPGNYGLTATDIDRDGDVDYYLSKCLGGVGDPSSPTRINRLFRNDGSGFGEVIGGLGLADANQSWCSEFGDIDNDGDMDAIVVNHPYDAAHPSGPSGAIRVYRQGVSGGFSDATSAAGVDLDFAGSQAVLRDFDNDGWLDLLVSDFDGATHAYLENDGDGTFSRREGVFLDTSGSPLAGITSVATGDLDHDGFTDAYLTRGIRFQPSPSLPDLLCLNQGNANGFIRVRLRGPATNRNGIGARLELQGPWGTQVREVRAGEGYGICHSANALFGVGSETGAPSLVIRWPSGSVDTLGEVPARSSFSVYEGIAAPSYTHADWTTAYFPDGGPDSGPEDDPDKDQLANLVEQFLGSDPARPNGHAAIQLALVEDGGTTHFQIEVARAPAEDLVPAIDFRSSDGSWSEDPQLEVVENSLTRYAARIPVDGVDTRLARLRITVAP